MNKIKYTLLMYSVFFFAGCGSEDELADAYGNFEVIDVMVSAEGNGRLLDLKINEGDKVKSGDIVGVIDTTQIYLKKEQLKASMVAVASKQQDVQVQLNVLNERKNNLLREKKRFEKLLEDEAATRKQVDDINGEIEVVEQQIRATRSQLNTANRGLMSEIRPMEVQVDQLNDQINKSIIMNPRSGTVLTKYVEEGEVVAFGRPLYKVADLDRMELVAYVSGWQLSEIAVGDQVTVRIDSGKDEYKSYEGTITWVASEAEFTPKVVQTREERVNMVYAIKVQVTNDGSIKIGMPGEVIF